MQAIRLLSRSSGLVQGAGGYSSFVTAFAVHDNLHPVTDGVCQRASNFATHASGLPDRFACRKEASNTKRRQPGGQRRESPGSLETYV